MKKCKNWWLLLLAPLFINGVCSKDEDDQDLTLPNADEYVTWKTSSHSGNLTAPSDSITFARSGNTTGIYGMTKPSPNIRYALTFDGPETSGTYSANFFYLMANGNYFVPSSTPVQVNVTNYGSTGQYLIGTYSGTIKDSTASRNVVVSGQFRIKNR